MAGSQTTFTELIKTENKNKPTPKMKNKNYMQLILYSLIIDDPLKGSGGNDVNSLPDSFREEKKIYFNGMCQFANLLKLAWFSPV